MWSLLTPARCRIAIIHITVFIGGVSPSLAREKNEFAAETVAALSYFADHGLWSLHELRTMTPAPIAPQTRAAIIRALPETGELTPIADEQPKLAAIQFVMSLHGLSGSMKIKLIDVPQAAVSLHARFVLLISRPALALLSADEVQAVAAHEIGHDYFWIEYEQAIARNDLVQVRELELRCDAVAVLTLRAAGADPGLLASAIGKMERFNERFGAASNAARYVTSSQRLRFQHLFNSHCDASRITLRITAYDRAHLPDEVTGPMVETVRRIFRPSGIEIEWITGELSDPEGAYQVYDVKRAGHEHEDACRARRDIALGIFPASPPTLPRGVLGMALPLSRSGLNVKVYADRVRVAAESENTRYATVLAHAVAHEVGHVLLRVSLHSARGLMSDTWTAHEYELMKTGSLLFLPAHTIKMRAMASGEACAVPDDTYTDAKRPQPAAAAPKPTLAKAQ